MCPGLGPALSRVSDVGQEPLGNGAEAAWGRERALHPPPPPRGRAPGCELCWCRLYVTRQGSC